MKKPVPPKKLDRVYRVAAGTAVLKDRVQKAKKVSLKKAQEAQKKIESDKPPIIEPDDKEAIIKKHLDKHGKVRVADIGY